MRLSKKIRFGAAQARCRRPLGGWRWSALGLGLLVLLGGMSAGASDEFERIREKAAEMVVSVNEAEMEPFAEGDESELEKAYGGYGYLLTDAKIQRLRELVQEAQNEQEKARRRRTARIIDLYAIGQKVAPVMDNCINSMTDKTVKVEGATLQLLNLNYRLAMQEDRDKRRGWWLAAGQLYKVMNVYRRNLMYDRNRFSQELGYEGYYPFLAEVEGWDLETMRTAAERLLDDTAASFETQLEALSERELDLELRKVRTYDAEYLFSFPDLTDKVGGLKVEDIIEDTFEECDLRLDKQRSLKIDLRDKDGRLPEATAWELQTGKAEVTMIPTERLSDLPALLGAVGEAQFYYNVSGDLPFEQAYIGSNVLPATYYALFAMIAEEPGWVEEHVKLKDTTAEEVAAAFKLRRLYLARQAAGRFLFQLRVHEDPNLDPNVYNEIMERALLWKHIPNDADTYLMANDNYESGGYLLGYVMAAQIRDALVEQLGPEWYRKKELGKKVLAGAAKGYGMSIADFLGLWGVTSLDPGVMAGQLAQR